jgi:hypothetical protein
MVRVDRLPISSLSESNIFLRSLWSVLRARFDRLGWQYTPHRAGSVQRIRFGWIRLGTSSPNGVEVIVQYGRIGVIKAIEFELHGEINSIYPGIEQWLRDSVTEAVALMGKPKHVSCCTQIVTLPAIPLGYYKGRSWYCGPLSNGNTEIGIETLAFDEVDAEREFSIRLTPLLDVLACMTNVVIESTTERNGERSGMEEDVNIYLEDPDWLDNFPEQDGYLRLTTSQVGFCDNLIGGMMVDERVRRAAHLFHKALTLYYKMPEFYDVATALFVSALETVDLPLSPPSTCTKCGQPTYKISRRVVELGIRHLGPGVERLFKDHYGRRSQYLHEGRARSSEPMQSQIIPQLDPKGIEGCTMPSLAGVPKNLMEFSSFVIRREMLPSPNTA